MTQHNPDEWRRFNDDVFCFHAANDDCSQVLLDSIIAAGIELIVDTRPNRKSDVRLMEEKCREADVYYIPAPSHSGSPPGIDRSVDRYTRLALRHKTCVVVVDDHDDLLAMIADQASLESKALPAAPREARNSRREESRP